MLKPGTASLVQDKAGKSRVGSDERNPAALEMIFPANNAGRRPAKTVSICGQAPSDFPEPDGWLVEQ
jgi:phosphoenolpyruvate synthase/pyruvate phosphate dikinase